MDKIDKTLAKIPAKQRKFILQATVKIVENDLRGLDVKKIKGRADIFRIRIGGYRIIFQKTSSTQNIVTLIAKRNERTYKNK